MSAKILLIGQTTLHWGRMEFGNIGNFYITEPFFEGIKETFPDSQIKTTLQFSKEFCSKYNVEVLPMELYYDFASDENLQKAKDELECVLSLAEGTKEQHSLEVEGDQNKVLILEDSRFIEAVQWCDFAIDFSGDIWGDNANFLGKERFEVGLIKDLVIQKLNKPCFMLAGSPGPFKLKETLELAKEVYKGFAAVTNREPISTALLEEQGFDLSHTITLPCPSFNFNAAEKEEAIQVFKKDGIVLGEKPLVGVILCGWNFQEAPFDKWPREDKEYEVIAEALKKFAENKDIMLCLMSHSNGFPVPPKKFEIIHGRDYPIIKQLEKVLVEKGLGDKVVALNQVHTPAITKALIGQFDMLISGRIHGATAGFSQSVPTVVLDYGHEPKAHKLLGFTTIAGQEEFLADPAELEELLEKIETCWANREKVRESLEGKMPAVKEQAKDHFPFIKRELVSRGIL